MQQIELLIAQEINVSPKQVTTVLGLFTEGATIPFIARYRKDATGGLDEVIIQQIQDKNKELTAFFERKTFIINAITEQGKMTDALQQLIDAATAINTLEDIYLPYKPKRKTKAQTARENGLAPLAEALLAFTNEDINTLANSYINEQIATAEDALNGAKDIIAEQISEDATVRAKMRHLFEKEAQFVSQIIPEKETEAIKYKDYFNFTEPIYKIPSHRTLAILRGFLEGFLRISIHPQEEVALEILEEMYVQPLKPATNIVKKAVKDSYKRLIQPSLETEYRNALKTAADEDAIQVFAENVKQLLLSSPLGGKPMLAIDPGYRTGCKIVCLDDNGKLLHNDLIFIHEKNKLQEAAAIVQHLVQKFSLKVIAIGDGTAGRETEQFIKGLSLNLPIFLVNEDGASVYSASEIARQEFPDYDITVRGAVSIGRRLMDPLAELVKIDPKSIGVGQYQHDVNQYRLKEKLDQTVESCVNAVGVNLNTASKQLLSYVSGIGDTLAENIIQYRNEVGAFNSRAELKKVPRLGAKAFEQCAGFLRIKNAKNPLDASGVHPETYDLVKQMATDLSVDINTLIGNENLVKQINAKSYITETVGQLTIQDILKELQKPGLDPRSELEQFEFAAIYKIEDVKVGDIVPGVVTNLTRFGAFIDIGVKQDGLVHISEIANKYISDPAEALKLNDKVQVKVLEVDTVRKRIALSIKQAAPLSSNQRKTGNNTPVLQQKNEPKPTDNLQDALSQLKKKFGK